MPTGRKLLDSLRKLQEQEWHDVSLQQQRDSDADDGAKVWISGVFNSHLIVIRTSTKGVGRRAPRCAIYYWSSSKSSSDLSVMRYRTDDSNDDGDDDRKTDNRRRNLSCDCRRSVAAAHDSAHYTTPSTNHDRRKAPGGGDCWRRGVTEYSSLRNNDCSVDDRAT